MFDDFDSAITEDVASHRRYCGFGRWVRTLDAGDRARAEELLADRSHNCRQLARYFESKGAKLNDQVLTRHRNRACCGQS